MDGKQADGSQLARELEGIYAIWLREFKVYTREKDRVISSIVSPLLWLFVFGAGLGSSVSIEGVNYQQFIFPGIIVMSTLFVSVFYGTYIIWDRKLDFLKEVLVAPISRFSIMAGKMLGGLTDVLPQVIILLIAGVLFAGISIPPISALYAILVALFIAVGMVALGLTLGANMTSPEGFALVMSFIVWPLFLFSGALYPVENLPGWLRLITYFDPLTYGVDLMHGVILGTYSYPPLFDIAALSLFILIMLVLGTISFGRMQQAR